MLRFDKYEGTGNDFIVVDRLDGGGPELSGELVQKLCDRHHGVGADGVLSILPDARGRARMRVQNADGSDSAMCGNGLRCVARYLYDRGLVRGESVELAAGDGLYRVERRAQGRFRVELGTAALRHPDLPEAGADGTVALEGFAATCVHLGNPHAVIFVDQAPRPLAERFGPALERHRLFPKRVNVSFAQARPGGFDAVVFERGVGITQACGSGAAAIGTAAVLRGLAARGKDIDIGLPGGVLVVRVDEALAVTMEGEARRVFAGEVELP